MENAVATIIVPLDAIRAAALFAKSGSSWSALGAVHITTDGDGTPTVWATDSFTAFRFRAQGEFARMSDADVRVDLDPGMLKKLPKSHKIARLDVGRSDRITVSTYKRASGASIGYTVGLAACDHDGASCDASTGVRLHRDVSYPGTSLARLFAEAGRDRAGHEMTAENPAYMERVARAAKIIGASAVSRAPREADGGARSATLYILGTSVGATIAEALVMPISLDLSAAPCAQQTPCDGPAREEPEDAA